jgi:hypothetical protein
MGILSSAGIDNSDVGDWPIFVGSSPVLGSDFDLVAQEDETSDSELELDTKSEVIAYSVFE